MSDKRWKQTERKVALALGGRRVPITGRTRGDEPDVQHANFSIEVKDRNVLPEWILDAMAQAVASKKTENQIPVVILHQKGMAVGDNLAIFKMGDIIGLWERGGFHDNKV